ncbi:hypothetical protein BH11PSE13_BH11PSE13_43310 [soil metagenome]
MKKQSTVAVAIAALAAVALLYTGASAWLGAQAQTRYENWLVTVLPLIDPAGTSARSYRKGVFSSEATLSIALPAVQKPMPDPEAAPGAGLPSVPSPVPSPVPPLRVNLVSRIQHGPLVDWRPAAAKIETRIASVDGGDPKLRGLFDGVATPVVAVIASFTGAWDGQLEWPAGRVGDAEASARWGALTYRFNGSADGKQILGTLAWPELRVDVTRPVSASPSDDASLPELPADPPMHLALAGLHATFQSQRQTDAQPWLLASGQASGTLDSLTLVRGDTTKQPLLSLEALKLQSDTHVSADQRIDVVQTVTGKGNILNTAVEALRYEVGLEGIDGAALLALQKAAIEMPGTPPAVGTPGMSNAPSNSVQTPAMGQALAQLLGGSPGYRVQLDATIAGQAGQAKARIALLPPTAGQALPTAPPPAMLLLLAAQRLEGSASMRFPKNWPSVFAAGESDPAASVAALTQSLDLMKAQGLIKDDGTAYSVDLLYSKGETKVNGQSLAGALALDTDTPARRSGAPRRSGRSTRQ